MPATVSPATSPQATLASPTPTRVVGGAPGHETGGRPDDDAGCLVVADDPGDALDVVQQGEPFVLDGTQPRYAPGWRQPSHVRMIATG